MKHQRSGFTLLEIVIALTITALLAVNIAMVSRTSSEATRSGIFWTTINDEADLTLDRISLAVMSSRADNIYPVRIAPGHTPEISYSVSLGVEEGELIESPPESISYLETGTGGKIVWKESPGLEEERSVTWSNWVPQLHMGEIDNGGDDNDNQLIDERGLAFDMVDDRVNIHLTISRIDHNGELVPTARNITVTCRN